MIVWRKKVENEDVLAIDEIDKKIVNKYNLRRLVNEKQAKLMNKIKRKWPIYNLPIFIPYIFISLIIYILFGDSLFIIS